MSGELLRDVLQTLMGYSAGDVTPTERFLLAVLADHVNVERGYAFPKIERLAAITGYSRECVVRTLGSLRRKRFVASQPWWMNGTRVGTRYWLTDTFFQGADVTDDHPQVTDDHPQVTDDHVGGAHDHPQETDDPPHVIQDHQEVIVRIPLVIDDHEVGDRRSPEKLNGQALQEPQQEAPQEAQREARPEHPRRRSTGSSASEDGAAIAALLPAATEAVEPSHGSRNRDVASHSPSSLLSLLPARAYVPQGLLPLNRRFKALQAPWPFSQGEGDSAEQRQEERAARELFHRVLDADEAARLYLEHGSFTAALEAEKQRSSAAEVAGAGEPLRTGAEA